MAKITKAAGTEVQVVGKVFILYGTVQAVSPDGTVRMLAPNSPVYADDHVITGSDGSVSIQLDGPPVTQIDLGRMTEIVIDEDVHAGVAPEVVSESTAEAELVQQSLLAGDQAIDLEATAAGGAAGSGGGHPIVIFTLDGNEGHITVGGADTAGTGSSAPAGTTGGFVIPDLGVPSIPPVTVPVDTTLTNGSGIITGLAVKAGDVISFNWSFDTDDATLYGNDFGFVVVGNGGVAKLADISQVGDGNATGWGTVTFTVIETAIEGGKLQIGFGVMNTGDSEGNSHLLIDKLTVNGKVVQSFESSDPHWDKIGNVTVVTSNDESGDPIWSKIGNVTVVTSHDEGGGTPAAGGHMVQITSTSGIFEAELHDFFGLSDGTLNAVSATRLGTLAWGAVDDEGLAHGNPGEQGPPPVPGQGGEGDGDMLVNPDPDHNEATFSGTLPHDFGPDGPGGISFAPMNGQTGFVGIEQVTYSWDGAANTLTAVGPRGALFTVDVNPLSGNYTLTLKDNVLHDPAKPPDDGHATENNAYVQQLTYRVTDTDGDHVNGTMNIIINDDMPGADQVKETTGAPVVGDLPFGADGPGDSPGPHVLSITGTGTANVDTTPDSAGVLTVKGNYGGTLAVDSSDGSYIYTPPATLTGDAMETFGFTLIDADGDKGSAELSILIDDPTDNT